MPVFALRVVVDCDIAHLFWRGLCLVRLPSVAHEGSLSLASPERRALFAMWNSDQTLQYLMIEDLCSIARV